MFESIFRDGSVPASGFFIVLTIALFCGIGYAFLCCYRAKSSQSFAIAVALLPMAVAMVIALVNGNLGIGVAIAGAFGLVRFRSAPGTAKEIAVIFIAMAAGLAYGMGYLAYGAVILLVSGGLFFAYERYLATRKEPPCKEKILKITIPEILDYTNVFDDIFATFTASAELVSVKTVNMGSMFRLTYRIILRDVQAEKPMLDAIRTRNGNLEIQCSRTETVQNEL